MLNVHYWTGGVAWLFDASGQERNISQNIRERMYSLIVFTKRSLQSYVSYAQRACLLIAKNLHLELHWTIKPESANKLVLNPMRRVKLCCYCKRKLNMTDSIDIWMYFRRNRPCIWTHIYNKQYSALHYVNIINKTAILKCFIPFKMSLLLSLHPLFFIWDTIFLRTAASRVKVSQLEQNILTSKL